MARRSRVSMSQRTSAGSSGAGRSCTRGLTAAGGDGAAGLSTTGKCDRVWKIRLEPRSKPFGTRNQYRGNPHQLGGRDVAGRVVNEEGLVRLHPREAERSLVHLRVGLYHPDLTRPDHVIEEAAKLELVVQCSGDFLPNV